MDNLVGFELPNLDRLAEYLPRVKSMTPGSGQILSIRLNGKHFPDLLCSLTKGDDDVTKVYQAQDYLLKSLGKLVRSRYLVSSAILVLWSLRIIPRLLFYSGRCSPKLGTLAIIFDHHQ